MQINVTKEINIGNREQYCIIRDRWD